MPVRCITLLKCSDAPLRGSCRAATEGVSSAESAAETPSTTSWSPSPCGEDRLAAEGLAHADVEHRPGPGVAVLDVRRARLVARTRVGLHRLTPVTGGRVVDLGADRQ